MDTFDTEKEFLASYNIHDFDVPLCTVDMCIFTVKDEQLQVLLTKRGHFPKKNQWALPGGFVGIDESLETADLPESFHEAEVAWSLK